MVETLRPAAEALGIQIEVSVPPEANLRMVQAIYGQLGVIMRNLVQNAIDIMAMDGGQLHVSMVRKLRELIIDVTDTGPGIPPDAHLAEPFHTTRPGGHGLGLYICTLIARVYDAHLEWYNQSTGGATFR